MKTKIIAIVGMCGSGKSVLADALVARGWGFVRFGQLTLDIVKEKGLEPNEKNEREIREKIRAEHGMGAFATLNIPKFDKALEEKNLVADGLYSWSEYKILKDYYGGRLTVVAIYAPPALRYERISQRFSDKKDVDLRNRNFSKEEAQARDFAEIENLDKGGPIAMADYTISNTGALEKFKEKIDEFIKFY
ncbi:AAA family ATPase [Patescibacteria group bacterium]|nr:AAA family ATPase [Patescibacteria group bacterium]